MLFLALAILLCGFVPGRVDAASLVKDATLTVKQTVTGSPNGTSEKFEYELKALTTGAPMPVGSSGDSYRFTLNGNESKDLVITYDTVDTYKYQLSQVVTSDKKDYDRQVYTIENYVLQNGASIWLERIQHGSVATIPYSPYEIVLPLKALPFMVPRNCLRRFTLFGINIIYRSLPYLLYS